MPRVTITVPDKNSQPYRFALDRKSVSLGRGSENDIVVDCSSVSVNHAVMERIKGGYQLRDLGSTNGTKLGGKARDEINLTDGISVKLGDVAFDFTLTSEEQMALASERPDGDSPILKEEEEEPKPRKDAPKKSSAHAPLKSASQPSPAASFFMTILFLLLAAGAFFIGLSVRYSKENPGRSMLTDIKNPPVVDASAAEEPEEGQAADTETAE
ncbi:FHA domain-containing protein [Haloferula rosea]|uniref:FHA domain-containing protein n=1 Tax=Haloferula rosea TaxID=490093 RepID=A0A934RCG3_9BACT|nr:FHA domain-containing protein [Haloferula rosea]MBK1825915.1 FHA domain-containing protein [Haloferula rosea]